VRTAGELEPDHLGRARAPGLTDHGDRVVLDVEVDLLLHLRLHARQRSGHASVARSTRRKLRRSTSPGWGELLIADRPLPGSGGGDTAVGMPRGGVTGVEPCRLTG